MGFNCKGYVIKRESVKTQAIEDRRVFTGSSQLSILRNDACALHMTGMRRVSTDGDILFCQTVLSDTHFLCLHYLYPHYPQMLRSASERKP